MKYRTFLIKVFSLEGTLLSQMINIPRHNFNIFDYLETAIKFDSMFRFKILLLENIKGKKYYNKTDWYIIKQWRKTTAEKALKILKENFSLLNDNLRP